jgi:hypothetical protein
LPSELVGYLKLLARATRVTPEAVDAALREFL